MCPNCILNQVGLAPGVYVAFAVCGIFFVAAIFAMLWAFKNGDFDDIESSKFDMLNDRESGARAAIEKKQPNVS
ncbi:MAG: cbb3-type cytochrome oxidase assembly protein [Candidatus Melainabacteria bacterium]|nr:cbb3-type cytochrome oxidase assembly protein [Candidatus Melainabacteria bacterium]